MGSSRRFLLLLIFCLLCAACGGTASPQSASASSVTLQVFAAASLTESFTAIAQQYHTAHPTTKVIFNFAGSQVLEQQMANGASADVFASADLMTMQKANTAGLVNPAQIFAQNKLVVILPASNPGEIRSLQDLAKKGVKIDLEATSVPAGMYTMQVLNKMAQSATYGATYKAAVLSNVISQEDNVKAVVQKVQLGEADAGFVYQTDVTTSVSKQVVMLSIPAPFNVLAQYPIAVVKQATHLTEAQAFVQYILSSKGQVTLASYHFLGVDATNG